MGQCLEAALVAVFARQGAWTELGARTERLKPQEASAACRGPPDLAAAPVPPKVSRVVSKTHASRQIRRGVPMVPRACC